MIGSICTSNEFLNPRSTSPTERVHLTYQMQWTTFLSLTIFSVMIEVVSGLPVMLFTTSVFHSPSLPAGFSTDLCTPRSCITPYTSAGLRVDVSSKMSVYQHPLLPSFWTGWTTLKTLDNIRFGSVRYYQEVPEGWKERRLMTPRESMWIYTEDPTPQFWNLGACCYHGSGRIRGSKSTA